MTETVLYKSLTEYGYWGLLILIHDSGEDIYV
jgi:hypothetical protein